MGIATSKPQSPEIWVAPDGNDQNSGDENDPYASIQTAIDDLVYRYGYDQLKTVKIKPGTYKERVVINVSEIELIGVSHNDPVKIEVDTGPSIVVTDMTKNAVEAFLSEDPLGIHATSDPDAGTFTYDGPTMTGREINSNLTPIADSFPGIFSLGVYIENIEADAPAEEHALQVISAPVQGEDDTLIRDVEVRRFQGNIGAKNALLSCIEGQIDGMMLDNSSVRDLRRKTTSSISGAPGSGVGSADEKMAIRVDTSVGGAEGSPGSIFSALAFYNILGSYQWYEGDVHVYLGADSDGVFSGGETRSFTITGSNESLRMVFNGSGAVTQSSNSTMALGAAQGNVEIKGSVSCETGKLFGRDIDKSSTGAMRLKEVHTRRNLTISDGATNVIKGGLVEGDLTINGGATAQLEGVTIRGNVIVDGDNSTLTLEGCHVKGDTTVDSGNDNTGVSVTMNGGSYMGSLTDPGANFTRNTGG